ncbi:MAG: hypothetical protein Q4B43_03055 [Bacteroidota bacterium]|nr:hypothetical protein [Bacteroidota bacterium]
MKGFIFFIGIGLLYLLFTSVIEYFLWLGSAGRTLLFWVFIVVEVLLFVYYICIPLSKLFKINKGISYQYASKIIGTHFTEIDDKLTNLLQLSSSEQKSELLLASIEQKAQKISPIPFTKAIDYRKSYKYLPLALIPIALFLIFYISGNGAVFSDSMNRVVNYSQKYTPPAPFEFVLVNKELRVKQGDDYLIKVRIVGKVIPEQVSINYNNQNYFMEALTDGSYAYRFKNVNENIYFSFVANEVTSVDYLLSTQSVPVITNMEMNLVFPSYLKKENQVIKGTGNAVIPEGTKISWLLHTKTTDSVFWESNKERYSFAKDNNNYKFDKNILQNIEYQIITSNNEIKNHEKLAYKLQVIKDAYPSIQVSKIPDSITDGKHILLGEVTDDYGFSKLELVYYDKNNIHNIKTKILPISKATYDRFHYSFPEGLNLEEGIEYEYYFQIYDNDGVNGSKSAKSGVYSHNELSKEQKIEKNLQEQNQNLNSLTNSIKEQQKNILQIDKLQQLDKETKELDFKEQQKIKDFIQRQEMQDKMMKSFSEKLKHNIQELDNEDKDINKELLENRLENLSKELDEKQKLLDELKDLSDKIKKEDLFDKIEKFKQSAKSQQKSLEQLVELTKRFYLQKKIEKLGKDLNNLAKEQDKIIDKENSDKKEQENINQKFNELQKNIDEFNKENKELKQPIDNPIDKTLQEEIKKDLNSAKDNLEKQNKQQAKSKQKSASDKMKQMAKKMQSSMMQMSMQQLEEDSKMLRQILDNLLAFSFTQEHIMYEFSKSSQKTPSYATNLKIQQGLKIQFKHVDDSLFALSLRNPMITENINKEIEEVHYNMDKSIKELSESNIQKGTSHQRFTITSVNKLSDFLSNIQNQMQMQMQGMGVGGSGMPSPGQTDELQLDDIIQSQEDLIDKMKENLQKGNQPKEGGQDSEEGDAGELYEIYKEQQMLREALEKMKKQGNSGVDNAVELMKQLEKQLLDKKNKNNVINNMQNIKVELLKLDKAQKTEGEDNDRKSNTNFNNYDTTNRILNLKLRDFLYNTEILNKEKLPVNSIYNTKIQNYYKK